MKKNDQLPRVPGIKENFVYRNAWTRLNVTSVKNNAGLLT